MKRTTFAASLVLVSWITAPAAQRTPQPTNEPAHQVFKMTGCLEQGDAVSAFRLSGASAIGQAPPRSSTSAAATDAKNAEVYELQATSGVSEQGFSSEKLQPEVGKRVEITIRPIEQLAPAPPPSTSASTDTVKKPTESPRQRYNVITLNRLADSCAPVR